MTAPRDGARLELPPAGGFRKDPPITDITATPLTITHHSAVTEDQIDHLGHMNVRFYGVNAQAGTAAVLGSLVDRDDVTLRLVDVYTRHHREQLLGSRLVVRSGIIDVRADGLRIYHELVNEDTDALAATFVHRLHSEDDSGLPVPFPGSVADRAAAVVVELPPRGATRSISLDTDPVASAPGLQVLRDRDLRGAQGPLRLARGVRRGRFVHPLHGARTDVGWPAGQPTAAGDAPRGSGR